jgi:Zn/Cd-binding protein ZinT
MYKTELEKRNEPYSEVIGILSYDSPDRGIDFEFSEEMPDEEIMARIKQILSRFIAPEKEEGFCPRYEWECGLCDFREICFFRVSKK